MEIWYHIGILPQQSIEKKFQHGMDTGIMLGGGRVIYAEGRGRMGSMVV